MSGYNSIEQSIGAILDRFPRVKSFAESTYQQANYHLFAEQGFEVDLHEEATLHSAAEQFSHFEQASRGFVGFYDICPWNSSMNNYFMHCINDESASIVVFSEDSTSTIATTTAWNYQQGSRTQWHPTCENTLIFNDIENGNVVTRITDIENDSQQTYHLPMQAVSPVDKEYLSVNYRRLDRNSPAYGYNIDDESPIRDPTKDGIVRVKFEEPSTLIIGFSDLMEDVEATVPHEHHYIHHVVYAPDGDRFAFLHRWVENGRHYTRLFVANLEGERRLLLENRYISHFCWLDTERLFLWGSTERLGRGYYIINTNNSEIKFVEPLTGYGDGHPSLSPDGEWVIVDSYPNRLRKRTLTLYHLDSGRVVRLGEFFSPFDFEGEKRCDLHPRWSPDGRLISIDSAHKGYRQSYIINVESIIK